MRVIIDIIMVSGFAFLLSIVFTLLFEPSGLVDMELNTWLHKLLNIFVGVAVGSLLYHWLR
jgi:uncharacterized membrane protein AbrB (regulator of aidB expression)